MNLRYATSADAAAISHIHAESWKHAYQGIVPQAYLDDLADDFWVSGFSAWLDNSQLSVRMIFDGDTPVGCTAYGSARDESMAGWGEIVSIYLLPEYMGAGVGQQLMQAALSDLREAGYTGAYLWVLRDNQWARRFYQKQGFTANGDKIAVTILEEQLTELRYTLSFSN